MLKLGRMVRVDVLRETTDAAKAEEATGASDPEKTVSSLERKVSRIVRTVDVPPGELLSNQP